MSNFFLWETISNADGFGGPSGLPPLAWALGFFFFIVFARSLSQTLHSCTPRHQEQTNVLVTSACRRRRCVVLFLAGGRRQRTRLGRAGPRHRWALALSAAWQAAGDLWAPRYMQGKLQSSAAEEDDACHATESSAAAFASEPPRPPPPSPGPRPLPYVSFLHTASVNCIVLALPPRSPVRKWPSRITASTADWMLSACATRPCRIREAIQPVASSRPNAPENSTRGAADAREGAA